MHVTGGYLDSKSRSPISMGAALAINGGIIAALLFAVPEVRDKVPIIFAAKNYTPDKQTDQPPPPQKKAQAQSANPKNSITPTKSLGVETDFTPFVKPTVIVPGGLPGLGSGGGDTVAPSKAPVFAAATLDPRYAAALQPPYPPGKQRIGEEGVVVVRILVGPDGRVKAVERQTGDEEFYKATAAQAVKRWRFKPATRDGIAVESWRSMTVRFQLTE